MVQISHQMPVFVILVRKAMCQNHYTNWSKYLPIFNKARTLLRRGPAIPWFWIVLATC